jgi:hypothetical protein
MGKRAIVAISAYDPRLRGSRLETKRGVVGGISTHRLDYVSGDKPGWWFESKRTFSYFVSTGFDSMLPHHQPDKATAYSKRYLLDRGWNYFY